MRAGQLLCILLGFILVIGAAAGCAYTKKEVIQVPCIISDTVSYAKDIAPIISGNCYDCHSNGSNTSGILLDSYNGLRFYAQNDYLYGTITHAAGYKAMPDGGSKINACDIATIKKWIDKNTPQ